MNTIEFTKAFKTAAKVINVFPNTIPSDIESCTGVFNYGGTADRYVAAGSQKFQFLCAHIDRQAAEQLANQMMNTLRTGVLQDDVIDGQTVLNIDILQIAPMYINKDEQNRYRFGFNIDVQIRIN